MFRQLTEQEKNKFKQWARANYIPNTEINPVWHPVVQAECRLMNQANELPSDEQRDSGGVNHFFEKK